MGLEVNIKKQLKEFTLDVSFQTENACVGILGASGCGKSMTLRAIAGVITPDYGKIIHNDSIFFDSEKRINQKPQKRRVGFLFQNYALFPNMTVEENIYAGLLKKTEEHTRIVKDAVERFHLSGLEGRYPKMLSGGQQQRAALARILVCKPQILLLDEPFSALDAYLKEELQLELLELLKEFRGCAILVTHDRDEAYKLCNQLMVMEHGSVIAHGECREMFASPPNFQTARLTGCKNISKAVKIGDYKVRAIDWNVELIVSGPISDNIKYIGIRAHDFTPFLEPLSQNCFELVHPKKVEGPFEENLIFHAPSGEKIWWKIERRQSEKNENLPNYLYIEPQNIMLLTEA
ncbi:MAG: sulfate/molybdate ABC transporter ATP-binding protein [Velocimicrobium sp.]